MNIITQDYPRCWIFDINRRVYRRDEQGKSSAGPIWREHWREVKIIGETKVSWITERREKIPKKGGHGVCFSEQELDEKSWIQENRHRISEAVRRADDFSTLKEIDKMLEDLRK